MSGGARDTPMMRQYLAIKASHPEAFVFYRMGDFYELFLEDAERAAPLLDIALTTRDKGKPDAIPMCGVPVHGAAPHIQRLTALGHRVAICEQVEDARQVGGRRLVKREVVEVLTPGLVGDPEGLEATREITVVAVAPGGDERNAAGIAALDASTGDFRCASLATDASEALPAALLEELVRIDPREVLLPEACAAALAPRIESHLPSGVVTRVPPDSYEPSRAPAQPEGFDPDARDAGTTAAAALLRFVASHQPFALGQATRLRRYALTDTMVLDGATRTHLELFENTIDRSRHGTLIERLDCTVTPLGARRLGRWVAYPLLEPAAIRARQDAVAYLADRDRLRAALREHARPIRDLERLLAKAARPGATPRDLAALRASLAALPALAEGLSSGHEDAAELPGAGDPVPASLPRVHPVPEAAELLEQALIDDPPAIPKGSRGALEVGYVRSGFRPELDALRESASKGREWIAGLEVRERERTGVASLKVRFHPVHGYSLEISKSKLGALPDDYERKQTLASVERFTTPELREMEQGVLGARERAAALEREIFESVRVACLEHGEAIRAAARAVGDVDALASLAEVARRDGWVRPTVDAGEALEVRAGRHPVVEPLLTAAGDDFVPNDADLDPSGAQLIVLTGPNMSGKSTYLRQVALIALLAQVGSFVPAEQARVGIVDRIFTRVGASDRLTRGESTFMVEMRETAEILRQASRRSLVILDEIGRGTSTFDGLSIAWAVAEYLHETPGLKPRTLFATHYHELTALAEVLPGVRNAHFEVREWGQDVVFLRRLVPGGASHSYGIQVARLAGLPAGVIDRSRQVLAQLEAAGGAGGAPQLSLFPAPHGTKPAPSVPPPSGGAERAVLDALRASDPENTTPLEALTRLQQWHERLRGEDED